MKIFITVFCILLNLIPVFPQINLYVAPNGNDQHKGTLKRPLKSIEGARDFINLNKNQWSQDIIVNFKGGEYSFSNVVEFTGDDNNVNGHKIIYQSYNDEKAIFNAGVELKNWVKHDGNVWRTSISDLDFRQLYIHERKLIRARYPDVGYHKLEKYDIKNQLIEIPYLEFEKFRSMEKVEMHLQQIWSQTVFNLDTITYNFDEKTGLRTNSTVIPEEAAKKILFNRPFPPKTNNQAYHFENHYSFITADYEWYLDRQKDSVYLKVPADININEVKVIAPKNEMFFTMIGEIGNPIKNFDIKGLIFKYSNWSQPSSKHFFPIQAGCDIVDVYEDEKMKLKRPPSAIYVKNAESINFLNNAFTLCGNLHMIDMHERVTNSSIKGNVFTQISGGSILMGYFGDYNESIETNPLSEFNNISNNYISHIGTDYLTVCGLTVGYVKNVTIEHNEISYTPYSGINIGWGWDQNINTMENNVVRYNELHNIAKVLGDVGGIYVLSCQPGTRIESNYIHDIEPSKYIKNHPCFGIYLDEGSGGTWESPMVVKTNVVSTKNVGDRYFFHMPGVVMYERNYNYSHDIRHKNYMTGNEVVKKAGLQDEYLWIKKNINK